MKVLNIKKKEINMKRIFRNSILKVITLKNTNIRKITLKITHKIISILKIMMTMIMFPNIIVSIKKMNQKKIIRLSFILFQMKRQIMNLKMII